MEKISWTDHVRNEEVLLRVKSVRTCALANIALFLSVRTWCHFESNVCIYIYIYIYIYMCVCVCVVGEGVIAQSV
jgi:hypothetical protein